MSDVKKAVRLLGITAFAASLLSLQGCEIAKEYYEYYLGGIDEGARQPTGYEDLKGVKQESDRLKVPEG